MRIRLLGYVDVVALSVDDSKKGYKQVLSDEAGNTCNNMSAGHSHNGADMLQRQ